MKAPAFWSQPAGLIARALAPLGWLYGVLTAARMANKGIKAPFPVICVGNFTAGGAGKTPTARWLAAWAKAEGLSPVILSRGYGGRLAGPVQVDPTQHGAADVGDEPLLLARDAPVVVSRNRPAGAVFTSGLSANLIIMDDGLQNPSLAKDLAIAVVDGGAGFGNGHCIPAGPLRAPLAAQLPFVDAVVIIGPGPGGDAAADAADVAGKPVFRAELRPDPAAFAALAGHGLLAFAGIGRPDKFFETLRQAGLNVAETRSFADHHAYSQAEASTLRQRAATLGLMLVTTEKDAVRFPGAVEVLPVSLAFAGTDGERLRALLSDRIRSVTSKP